MATAQRKRAVQNRSPIRAGVKSCSNRGATAQKQADNRVRAKAGISSAKENESK